MPFRLATEKSDALCKVPIFHSLGKRDLAHVARIADEVECRPGKVLMREGTLGREFILIVDGGVRVERGENLIARCGPGDFLGELALLDGKPRTATVTAETACTLLVIHSRQFWQLLETVPGVQRKLLIGLAGRLRAVEDRLL